MFSMPCNSQDPSKCNWQKRRMAAWGLGTTRLHTVSHMGITACSLAHMMTDFAEIAASLLCLAHAYTAYTAAHYQPETVIAQGT